MLLLVNLADIRPTGPWGFEKAIIVAGFRTRDHLHLISETQFRSGLLVPESFLSQSKELVPCCTIGYSFLTQKAYPRFLAAYCHLNIAVSFSNSLI